MPYYGRVEQWTSTSTKKSSRKCIKKTVEEIKFLTFTGWVFLSYLLLFGMINFWYLVFSFHELCSRYKSGESCRKNSSRKFNRNSCRKGNINITTVKIIK